MPGASLVPVKGLIFRQLFEKERSTYSYLLADAENGEGVIIDPVLETVSAREVRPCRFLGVGDRRVAVDAAAAWVLWGHLGDK